MQEESKNQIARFVKMLGAIESCRSFSVEISREILRLQMSTVDRSLTGGESPQDIFEKIKGLGEGLDVAYSEFKKTL